MKYKIKTIIRSLLRYRLYTTLNITGLALALTSIILIVAWILNEKSYDKFHKNYDNIFQVNYKTKEGERWAGSPAPLQPAIKGNVAGLTYAARIRRCASFAFKYNDYMFYEGNGLTTDPEIFDIFSFKIIEGDPKVALNETYSMVITESFAKRYFGNENPVNKEIQIEGQGYLTIKALIEDVPEQSHIVFDYLLSHKFAEEYHLCGLNWGDPNFRTFILTEENANIENIRQAITNIGIQHHNPHLLGEHANTVHIRALKDIYLDYKIENRLGESGDFRYLYIFGSIALFILLLACANYIILTISLFVKRQKSVSLNKVCGAGRSGIFKAIFSETSIAILFAFIISLFILVLFKPSLYTFLGKNVNLHWSNLPLVSWIIILIISTILICGTYPSILFSKPRVIEILNRYNKRKTASLKAMAIFQNVVSIILIICTLTVLKQLNYINNKNLGFKTDQIAYFYLRGPITEKTTTLINELQSVTSIDDICMKDCVPFNQRNGTVGVSWLSNGRWQNDDYIGFETTRIDPNYFEMMDVQFASGRNFSEEYSTDVQNYIINETAAKQMKMKNPVGKDIMLYGQAGKIVGVIKDTYFKNLHEQISPQLFYLYKDLNKESYFSAVFMRINNANLHLAINKTEKIWKELNLGIPFEYEFLDQNYTEIYRKDKKIAQIISVFTILSVVIACLGLFGQITVSCENRIKEIGVRKVTGAKISEVILLINKNFLTWVLISFIIANPVAFYITKKWLENFAYKTEVNWWVYAFAGVISLIIALTTVSWQSIRAARKNPVEALRYE